MVIAGLALLVQGIIIQQEVLGSLGFGLVIVGTAIAIFSKSFAIIGAGEVGVVYNIFSGVQDEELDAGLQLVWPILQHLEKFSIREQKLVFAAEDGDDIAALSQDVLPVSIDVTIRYQIIPDQASAIYQTLGKDGEYQLTLIRPQARSTIRNAVAQYKAADLITSNKKNDLESDITENLSKSLKENHIILLEVFLDEVHIPQSDSEVPE